MRTMAENDGRAKPLPQFKTDEDAERFVDEADLTEYDLSRGRMVRFEFNKTVAWARRRQKQSGSGGPSNEHKSD